jgi:hypothetical protein
MCQIFGLVNSKKERKTRIRIRVDIANKSRNMRRKDERKLEKRRKVYDNPSHQ